MTSRLGLSTKLSALILAAVLTVVAILTISATALVRQIIADEFRSKAEAIALALAHSLTLHGTRGLDDSVESIQTFIESVTNIPGVAYVYIQDHEGSILAHTFRPTFPAYFVDQNWIGEEERNDDSEVKVAPLVEFELRGRSIRAIDVATPFGGATRGVIHVGMDWVAIDEDLAFIRSRMLWWGAALAVVSVLLCLLSVLSVVLRPLRELTELLRQFVTSGDLTRELRFRSSDELGELADVVRQVVSRLRAIPQALKGSLDGMSDISGRLVTSGEVVSEGTQVVQDAVEDATRSIVQMMSSLQRVSNDVDRLYGSAEESQRLLAQIDEANERASSTARSARATTAAAADAVADLNRLIKAIGTSVDQLRGTLEESGEWLSRMESSVQTVVRSVESAAKLSEAVVVDADRGLEVVADTLEGIQAVQRSTRAADGTMAELRDHIGEIGGILTLIEEVTDQTTLLALNASILAAQAGAHGGGFTVVANEIKSLADRTRTSTHAIAGRVVDLQDKSAAVRELMRENVHDVEHALELGGNAELALSTIRQSARRAKEVVAGTAAAAAAHRDASGQVTRGFQQFKERLDDIAAAAERQLRSSEVVKKSAGDARALTEVVQEASDTLVLRSRRMTELIIAVNRMANELRKQQSDELSHAEHVVRAAEIIDRASRQQSEVAVELSLVIADLNERAIALQGQLGRFRVARADEDGEERAGGARRG